VFFTVYEVYGILFQNVMICQCFDKAVSR